MDPLLIGTIGLLAVIVLLKRRSSASSTVKGEPALMTPDQYAVYVQTLQLDDPVTMLASADNFAKLGFSTQATLIRKRANLKQLPEEIKQARSEAFRKFMASTDKDAIIAIAQTFQDEGCTDAANALLKHAESLP